MATKKKQSDTDIVPILITVTRLQRRKLRQIGSEKDFRSATAYCSHHMAEVADSYREKKTRSTNS